MEVKAEKILYRLRDESHISFSEFNYLMNLLREKEKCVDLSSVNITYITPQGYHDYTKPLEIISIPSSKL